ncbi:MAG: translocation/assembly module TamB domain-containing protein [Trueperaceae bacterium]|nr:translocation/assembly module TamB domain-containing protein [Trueperaceae bacterium]
MAGEARLALSLDADRWLDGSVVGGAVAGVPLPDLTVSADGSVLSVDTDTAPAADGAGSAVEARLDLLDQEWTVAVRDLELPSAGRLALTASGTGVQGPGAQGTAELELAGPDGGTVLGSASLRSDALHLTATGTVRDATVDVDVRRDQGAWSGQVDVRSLPTPAGVLSVSGEVRGEGALPDTALDVQLDGPVNVAGSAAIADTPTTGPTLTVELDAGLPGAGTVAISGQAWPSLDLRIAGDAEVGDAEVGDAEAGELATNDVATAHLTAPSWNGDQPWRLTGATTLDVPGVTVQLEGRGGVPHLRLVPTALPGATSDDALVAALPAAAPLEALATIRRDGLTAEGEGRLAGTVAWSPVSNANVNDVTYRAPAGDLVLNGTVRDGVADLTGRFRPASTSGLPAELIAGSLGRSLTGEGLTLSLQGGLDDATLRIDDASDAPDPLAVQATWSGDDRTVGLTLSGGGATADLTLAPDVGLTGTADLRDLALRLPGGLVAALSGDLVATGMAVEGRLELDGAGRATLDGRIGLSDLLPAAYRATDPGDASRAAASGTEASIRISELDVSSLPGVSRLAPRATGGIAAVIELRGSRVLAQLTVPDLRAGGRAVPLRIEGAGDLGAGGTGVGFSGAWAGSPIQGTADLERLQLLWTLERFPIQAPIEARVGPLDVEAEATGVLRLEIPWRAPGSGSVRIATERVRLERSGIVTTGTFAADVQAGRLTVNAAFEGDGRWEAHGTIAQDELDFELRADQADATPLLGLVPSLARLNVEALGDLTVDAQGTIASPRITARTQDLELALAGARYRLTDTDVALDGADLSVNALISGVQPVGGQLRVAGDGRLRLDPWRLEDAGLSVDGDLNVPLIGEVTDLTGVVRANAEGRPYLDVTGRIGAPLRVEGTLWPLDLRASGQTLSLRAPSLLLDDSTSDVDLRLRYDELFHLSGRVEVRDGRFVLGIRPPAGPAPEDGTGRRSALSRFVFDDLALVGRRLSFSENFGSALFDADLSLAGSAAAPRLSGAATAQRGTFRFSGRDFTIDRAVARFEPSRGAYPVLEVEAVATFDKRDVLASAARGVTFEQPTGATFEVRLTFEAEVLPTPGEPRPFRLDLDPVLTSNAVVSIPAGEGLSAGARSLSEAELLSLVALGRLDLSGELAGGGVAGGVARSALDSAVDLLILAELQSALSEALGLDVVEIRTSTLSSVLAGDDDPFGVSLRLGGYVGEGLFASYEVGRFADANGDDALSNTLALTYELGPVAFDLATRLDFADVAAVQPTPELTAGLRYQLTPFLAIEGGASLSTPESEARFGITLRW